MLAVLYNNLSIISLVLYALILLIAGWFFYSKRLSVKLAQIFVLLVIVFLFLQAGFLTFLQYFSFKSTPPGMYLLPPYQPITYFLSYVWLHFWAGPVAAVGFSLVSGFAAWVLNYLRGERFFEKEEIFLLALAGLTSGWPNFLMYLGLAIILMILVNFGNLIIYQDSQYRLPSGLFIIVAALIILIFGDYLAPYLGIGQFKI